MQGEGHWPAQPYRGLEFYRREDRPLLAGREKDVVYCATLLAHSETRVLLLHGMTGCGKSSFLRAGLIPALETHGHVYRFFRRPEQSDESIFIRSTNAPVDQVAAKVYEFVSQPYIHETARGITTVDLSAALLGHTSWHDYLVDVRDNDRLIDSLRVISTALPWTFVIVVDQAEEVLTLNKELEGTKNRQHFFRLLRDLQDEALDIRMILALRTEYYGRFVDTAYVASELTPLKHHLLDNLRKTSLVDAITRPTLREGLGNYEAPYNTYGFEYEGGLPELIATEIIGARYSGSAPPVLQLVCCGLHRDVVLAAGRTIITKNDYIAREGTHGLIIHHVLNVLKSIYKEHNIREPDDGIKKVLAVIRKLYNVQEDGSVVAITVDNKLLRKLFENARLKLHFDVLSRALADPDILVLRRIRSIDAQGEERVQWSLGHDSSALALEKAQLQQLEHAVAEISDLKRISITFLSTTLVTLISAIVSLSAPAVTIFLQIRFKTPETTIETILFGASLLGVAISGVAVTFTLTRQRVEHKEKPDQKIISEQKYND